MPLTPTRGEESVSLLQYGVLFWVDRNQANPIRVLRQPCGISNRQEGAGQKCASFLGVVVQNCFQKRLQAIKMYVLHAQMPGSKKTYGLACAHRPFKSRLRFG